MRRLGYGDPVRVKRAKQARRLSHDERNRLTEFLLAEGRRLSSETIARRFNISMNVTNSHRRKLGVSLSWHEARALSSTEKSANERPKRNANTSTNVGQTIGPKRLRRCWNFSSGLN